MMRLVHDADMPMPTRDKPWVQVEWLFSQQVALARSTSAASNFRTAKKHFVGFLKDQKPGALSREPYFVNREFDEYTLLRYKQYVDDLGMSSGHTNSMLSAARVTLQTAIHNNWLELTSFIDFALPLASRETNARSPYSAAETASIVSALRQEIQFARKTLRGYSKTGLGKAPQTVSTSREDRLPWGWWCDEHNMRWYFENRLDCEPITGADPAVRKQHRNFLAAATNHHGGLHNLYRRWGVTSWIGPELILPYLYKLVAETGLNPTVAMSLRLDAYQEEHPLTGRPYIRYWKERGCGENELHVDLIDSGVVPLDDQQSREVKRIWNEVATLTVPFRDELLPESRNRLFVYQSRGVKNVGEARDFLMDASSTGMWAKKFVERHQLKDDNGRPLNLTLSRFRPSLVSRMVKRGVDIQIIQSILGHKSVLTTLRYLDSYDFSPHARREVQNALEHIRANRREHENAPKPVAGESFEKGEVVFATGLALCKDVFDPPNNIRTAAGIKQGSPCTLFNMCLRCPNVLIMEDHLPRLFALRRQYLIALEQGLSTTTHRAAVQQNLHVLNNLLDVGKSDWPADVLEGAERRSEFAEPVVDPVAIRGVVG